MPVKGNAALRYILISSWAKEHKREWFQWKLQEKLLEFTTWNYARFGYLILALKTFSTGPIFKREIAFSSRTRPRRGRSYSHFLVAEILEEVHFHLNKLGLHLPLSLAEQKLLLTLTV